MVLYQNNKLNLELARFQYENLSRDRNKYKYYVKGTKNNSA